MRELAFEFLKNLIEAKGVGNTFKRAELVNMLLQYLKPDIKNYSVNSTIRTVTNPTLNVFIKNNIIERIEKGKYKIINEIPANFIYKNIKDDFKKSK